MIKALPLYVALANPWRLRIMNLLLRKPLCVCQLVYLLRAPYSRLSNHLAILKRLGLVKERREALWVQYSCCRFPTSSPVAMLLKSIKSFARHDRVLRNDLDNLRNRCDRISVEELCGKVLRRR